MKTYIVEGTWNRRGIILSKEPRECRVINPFITTGSGDHCTRSGKRSSCAGARGCEETRGKDVRELHRELIDVG